jgi:serine/threonine-protein kinase RsbW
MDAIKIQIPSLVENIRIVESFIDNAKDKFNFNEDIYGNIMIAITESVNNAIVHGNASDKSKNVSLSLQVTDNSLTFTVEDQGNGFNYENLEDPTSPENIEKIGGRGIFLMKHLCDSVTFHDDGKKVELSFYID